MVSLNIALSVCVSVRMHVPFFPHYPILIPVVLFWCMVELALNVGFPVKEKWMGGASTKEGKQLFKVNAMLAQEQGSINQQSHLF